MKNLLFTLFLTPFVLCSQNLADIKPLTCESSSAKMSLLFVEYMKGNYTLSTKSLLKQWEEKCGLCEPVYRAKILFALKTGTLNDSLFCKQSIDHIFNYQSRMKQINSSNTYWYDSKEAYYGYVPPGECIFRSKPSHCPQCFCQLGCMVFMHFLCKIVQKQHFFSTKPV